MKCEIKKSGPAVVTLPTWDNWPKTKAGNPMEIVITNTGDEPLVVEQSPAQFIVAPAALAKFLRDE